MKSATCGHTKYFQFSLLITLSLLALPLLKANAIPGGPPSIPKAQELQARIVEQQKVLRVLQDQIDHQASVAESARETMAGAGALGDAANVYVDEYMREQKKLDQLKKDLAPRIRQAEQTLAALQAQQTALSAQAGPKSQPIRAKERRPVPAAKKTTAGSGAALDAKQ